MEPFRERTTKANKLMGSFGPAIDKRRVILLKINSGRTVFYI